MILRDFLCTCVNQWGSRAFSFNPLFRVKLLFEDNSHECEYILYSNYCSDINYLCEYSHREVNYWLITGMDSITIEIEGHS